MPPKKGKKGKSPKGAKGPKGPKGEKGPKPKKLPNVTEGLQTSEMTTGQLMTFIKRLLAENDMELEEKNLFLLEKSKLYNYWTQCMDRVKTLKEEVKNSTVKRDKAEVERNAEKDYQGRKLRALQNEEMKNLGIIRLQHLKQVKRISDEIWDVENILRDAATGKRMQIRTQMRAQFEILRSLHTAHVQALQNMMFNLSKAIRSKEMVWERHFDCRWEKSSKAVTKMDKQINAQKTTSLFMMNDLHERILQDLKTFFNDMTSNNFAVITTLEQEIDTQKSTNNRLARDLVHVKKQYAGISKPLERMQQQMTEWKDQDSIMRKKSEELHHNEVNLESKLLCENNLNLLIELLIQRLEIASKDFDKVKSQFAKGLVKMQQKMTMNNLVNQLKLNAAQKDTVILRAIQPAAKSGNSAFLQNLEKQIDSQRRQIRRSLQNSLTDGRQVLDPCVSPCGLQRKQGTILPMLVTPENYSCFNRFQGQGQGIQTSVRYKGPQYVPKASSRDLGYGYFHIPPSELTPPPSREDHPRPQPIKTNKVESVNAATSTLRYSQFATSKSNVNILAAVPVHAVLKHQSRSPIMGGGVHF
ncbi:unnamed protein product [Allacma fusca]|uniref:Dynein regulatory complex subunit 4 n=1 Tax=Allacma fusca TaxID=39272 RepID=A0A8J2L9C2_9HEXA|nr:unnamed protein product [Allacma fusca]